MQRRVIISMIVGLVLVSAFSFADDHSHHHGRATETKEPVEPPRVFLDKNLRIVMYQLNRLDNERLLLVERSPDDAKYAPVYRAILTRAGMSRQDREQAVSGLVTINKSDAVVELVAALEDLDATDRAQQRVGRQLAVQLLTQLPELLSKKTELLTKSTQSDNPILRASGYAGLIVADHIDVARSLAEKDNKSRFDFLKSVPLVPQAALRALLRDSVVAAIAADNPASIRRVAIASLASIPHSSDENFRLVAPLVNDKALMNTAVRTLLQIPRTYRNDNTAAQLVAVLVNHAETTPAADRTTNEFIDAMQLADQLLRQVPVAQARAYRDRLRKVTVRVVRIQTVEEEMRYDTTYFAVEAGRDVQVVLVNEDLMPHNLVVTVAGALREVAEEGALVGADGGVDGKQYVPKSDKVLFATHMVPAGTQERLTFTAPNTPGEYPYVCTFPRHWMRMYGVMVVVEDLDEWLKNPVKPADPIGNTREFVQAWTIDDFQGELEGGLRRSSPAIGERIFTEATCAQCHKFAGQGGAVGPELTDVYTRWKNDGEGILREILDPSHKIDPKYAVHVVVTLQGKVVSGILVAEDEDSITILDNPEAPKPTLIKKRDIDDIVKSAKSMMPKALLDQFTKDEIFELLAYLKASSTE